MQCLHDGDAVVLLMAVMPLPSLAVMPLLSLAVMPLSSLLCSTVMVDANAIDNKMNDFVFVWVFLSPSLPSCLPLPIYMIELQEAILPQGVCVRL